MSKLGAPLSQLFPDLFNISRPITTPDVPVIVAASILTAYDSPMLPIVKVGAPPSVKKKGVKLYQAIGGLPIIRLLMETSPMDYYKMLWGSCTTTSIWIGSLKYEDTLDNLLRIFELTGFGNARVDAQSSPPALITLDEVLSLYGQMRLGCDLKAKVVASRAISVDPDISLRDSMKIMCEKRVRRLFLKGKDGTFVSDRGILGLLFSPTALRVARDSPEFWMDLSLSKIQPKKAGLVSPDATVEDVARMLQVGRDVFVLEDGNSVISKWDLVLKPWKLGKLSLSPRASA